MIFSSDEQVRTVAIWHGQPRYPGEPPFHPEPGWPDAPFADRADNNPAYAGVRECFRMLRMDAANMGTAAWNPLSDLVQSGDTVVLKPNLIREAHLLRPAEWQQVVTHGSVVRAVADYVAKALGGAGRIVICDGPQTDSDFEEIVRRTGLRDVVSYLRSQGVPIELLDLRRDRWHARGDVTYRRENLPGDPRGYTTVELGQASEFRDYRLSGRFYGADYDMSETARFHNRERHAYVLCRTVLDADVVINLPKFKTHKKTGVTLSLKNMVGINGYRNCLPHHTVGTPDQGGDEFPQSGTKRRLESGAIVVFKRVLARLGGGGAWARVVKRIGRAVFGDTHAVIRSGNWHGNETIWRTVLDLNKCLFYFDGSGARRGRPLQYLTIVDGILAGDGNGPQAPDTVPAGVIAAGYNPLAVDTVCTVLAGFDWRRVPMLARGWGVAELPLAQCSPSDVVCCSNRQDWSGTIDGLEEADHLGLTPHFGWIGRIERVSPTSSAA